VPEELERGTSRGVSKLSRCGNKEPIFTNVIATKDPEASRRVVVAAHFDSKFFPSYPQNQVRVSWPAVRRVRDADGNNSL
jgi:hypothetical protein